MNVEIVRVAEWERYGWLRHGFSTRSGGCSEVYGGGDLNLGFTRDDARECVVENRRRFLGAAVDGARLVTVKQVHGAAVEVVGEPVGEAVEADGMITAEAGVALGILTADCVPVLVADTRLRVVGAFHAGWRGTAAGIAAKGVEWMRSEFGSEPEHMVAAVGPSIGACCYRVGEELRGEFEPGVFARRDGGLWLDLWEANRRQLVAAGLGAECVTVVGECTSCARVGAARKYFSHRAEEGFTGRSLGVIAVVAAD